MSQNNDPLIYHEEGEIGFIEINRPEKKNALNYECWQLFDKYCDQLIDDHRLSGKEGAQMDILVVMFP